MERIRAIVEAIRAEPVDENREIKTVEDLYDEYGLPR